MAIDSDHLRCEVLVVGAGMAGVAAAAAAGRLGKSVILLERGGFAGGTATAAQVSTICGLYLRDSQASEPTFVCGGFVREFADSLQGITGKGPIRLEQGLWILPAPPVAVERAVGQVLSKFDRMEVIYHAVADSLTLDNGWVTHVRGLAWNRPVEIECAAVVDATGDATVCALAGAEMDEHDPGQVSALVFNLENVSPSFKEHGMLEVRRELRRAVEAGQMPAACERFALIPGTFADGHLSLKLNLPLDTQDRPFWRCIAEAEQEGRALVVKLCDFLVRGTETCRNARLASIAPQLGVRSGRRVCARHSLTEREVLDTVKSDCGVARGCWPMERWSGGLRPQMTYFPEVSYYDISFDCLRPQGLENVFCAGKCIGATAAAISSARVIGTGMATGWAAGTAAAFHASGRPAEETIETIRQQMNP